jgi:transforming growth factor-beta-induced protein
LSVNNGGQPKIKKENTMSTMRNGFKFILLALAALVLLSVPLAAGAAGANGITTPANGATVSGVVDVKGTANNPAFSKWQLDLLPGGDANAAIFLALGEQPGDFSYSLNTNPLPNGEHALRLRVVRSDGNYDEYVNKFTIANGPAKAAAAKDIVATAIGAGQFNTLVAAVKAAGLVGALQGKGPFTVFAPTDAAFAKLPAGTVEGLLKDPKALANILLYHVVSGEVKAAAVKDGLTTKTLQGSPVTFKVVDGKPMINGANIVATDVMASNGVIHVIDSVILPPAPAAAPAAAAPAATPAAKDIVATAIGAGQFNTLVAAVKAAGLVGALQGKGPFTVFAPTDAAFAKLPAGTVEGLLKDPKALANILLYHVVSGEVKAAAVKDGLTTKTLQGSPVTFKVVDGKPMINDANIVATDVMASNGVIHVIDSVILPPAAVATPATVMSNGISAPKDGASVSGVATIKGYASDPRFSKWQLDLLPGGNPNAAIFLALGDQPGELSYTLDTTGLPNGEHAFRLRVVRPDGNYDEYVSKFVIANK